MREETGIQPVFCVVCFNGIELATIPEMAWLEPGEVPLAAAAAATPACCIEFLRWSMASWGDIGGKGTPLLGGRPGLELKIANTLISY